MVAQLWRWKSHNGADMLHFRSTSVCVGTVTWCHGWLVMSCQCYLKLHHSDCWSGQMDRLNRTFSLERNNTPALISLCCRCQNWFHHRWWRFKWTALVNGTFSASSLQFVWDSWWTVFLCQSRGSEYSYLWEWFLIRINYQQIQSLCDCKISLKVSVTATKPHR